MKIFSKITLLIVLALQACTLSPRSVEHSLLGDHLCYENREQKITRLTGERNRILRCAKTLLTAGMITSTGCYFNIMCEKPMPVMSCAFFLMGGLLATEAAGRQFEILIA